MVKEKHGLFLLERKGVQWLMCFSMFCALMHVIAYQ